MVTLQPHRPDAPARRRTGLVVAGVVTLVAGVLGALGLWLLAEQRYDDGVEALARAPVGCETVVSIESTDGQTQKTLFALPDGREIEAVLMRYDKRRTLCISTQAGCAMGCPFCATGQIGFMRNLSAGEILAQVLHYARLLRQTGENVTNIVFMGMGEPLANYAETWRAIRRLNEPAGFNLGARRMTLSTVGLVPAIRRMSREPEQVGLAVSLHAPTDELRDTIVPLNRRYPLSMLMKAVRDYVATTGRRVTFEYALMDDLNDSANHADQLGGLIQGLLSHVNLIPLNPTPNSPWSGSPDERVYAFRDRLAAAGISTTIRLRRGVDIAAGCGQLHNAHSRENSELAEKSFAFSG
jgi:23S rRNA (adenine2503-C2)-methyltransferase